MTLQIPCACSALWERAQQTDFLVVSRWKLTRHTLGGTGLGNVIAVVFAVGFCQALAFGSLHEPGRSH